MWNTPILKDLFWTIKTRLRRNTGFLTKNVGLKASKIARNCYHPADFSLKIHSEKIQITLS
jgi:hypothetical protein